MIEDQILGGLRGIFYGFNFNIVVSRQMILIGFPIRNIYPYHFVTHFYFGEQGIDSRKF